MYPNQILAIQEKRIQQALSMRWEIPSETPSFLESMALATIRSQSLDLAQVMPREIVTQHQKLMNLAHGKKFEMPFLGASMTSNEPRIYQGRDTDWAVMPLERDTFYIRNQHRFVLPQAVYRHLKHINNAGVDFDQLYVAHELPKGLIHHGQAIAWEYLAPPAPPAPPAKVARLNILNRITQHYWQAVRVAVLSAGIGTAIAATVAIGIPVLAVGAALAIPATAGGLDPIIFGVNIDYSRSINGQHPALIYVLAQWAWPESK